MKTCGNCLWHFSNICNMQRRFVSRFEKTCLDYKPRPPKPGRNYIWKGSQIQWEREAE